MMNQGLDVEEFVEGAAAQMSSLSNEDPDAKADLHVLWGHEVATVYTDAVQLHIDFDVFPEKCPEAAAETCHITRRAKRLSALHVSAQGCRRLVGRRYFCSVHKLWWQSPRGLDSRDCNVVGDRIGHAIVSGDFWPEAWSLFQDTENYRVVEKCLRRRTAARIRRCISQHCFRDKLGHLGSMILHAAVLAFCRSSPGWMTIKSWFMTWLNTRVAPMVPALEATVCGAFGAVASIDFSACDARQLRRPGTRQERRTFGGITGLGDVALLPDMFAGGEDRWHIETLILVWFEHKRHLEQL